MKSLRIRCQINIVKIIYNLKIEIPMMNLYVRLVTLSIHKSLLKIIKTYLFRSKNKIRKMKLQYFACKVNFQPITFQTRCLPSHRTNSINKRLKMM